MSLVINPYRFASSGGGGGSTYEDEVLADSPLFYYRLEETSGATVSDESGNNNDGTVNGADLNVSGPSGLGSAASFDGTDDSLTTIEVGSTQQLTVEVWAKVASGAGDGLSTILFGQRNAASSAHLILCYVNSDGTLEVLHRNATSGSGGTITSTATIDDDVWHHVVATFDVAGNSAVMYIDDTQADSGTLASSSNDFELTNADFTFAAEWQAGDGAPKNHLACVLDEPAFYLSELSATRVSAHYDAAS